MKALHEMTGGEELGCRPMISATRSRTLALCDEVFFFRLMLAVMCSELVLSRLPAEIPGEHHESP